MKRTITITDEGKDPQSIDVQAKALDPLTVVTLNKPIEIEVVRSSSTESSIAK